MVFLFPLANVWIWFETKDCILRTSFYIFAFDWNLALNLQDM